MYATAVASYIAQNNIDPIRGVRTLTSFSRGGVRRVSKVLGVNTPAPCGRGR